MKIDQAIKLLKEVKKSGTKDIILAFWESDMFTGIKEDEWAGIAEDVEDNFDWSRTTEDIEYYID
jgi:hypothetical protein